MQLFIDEAWRGPLAWPLYIWMVKKIKNPDQFKGNPLFTDSKKLSPTKRLLAYQAIQTAIKNWEIEARTENISANLIDQYGITRALNLAISKGLFHFITKEQKKKKIRINKPFYPRVKENIQTRENKHKENIKLIIDGKTDFRLRKELGLKVETIIQGDSKVLEISIASILAKVARDIAMGKLAKNYPEYGFEQHKGYGTAQHYQAIEKHWISPEHRKLFLKKLIPEWKISSFDRENTNLD